MFLIFFLQMVAAQFKNLAPEERAKWDEKANADKKRYAEEMANYDAPEDDDEDDEPTKKKVKKDKNAPKKARSAYTYFGNDMRETIKAENSDLSFAETNKLLGERWKALDSDDKQKYEDMAAEDKKRYKKEMANYTPPDASRDKKGKTKAKKDPNAPKKPMSSFMYFSTETRPKIKAENPGISFGELGKKAGELFRNLTQEEKKVYEKKAATDKIRYEKEMEAYKSSKKAPDDDDGVDDHDDDDDDDSDDDSDDE